MAGFNKMRVRTFRATDKLRNLSRRQRELVKKLRQEGVEEKDVTGYVTEEVVKDVAWWKGGYEFVDENIIQEIKSDITDYDEENEYNFRDAFYDAIESIISDLKSQSKPKQGEADIGVFLDERIWSVLDNATDEDLKSYQTNVITTIQEMRDVGYVGEKVKALMTQLEDLFRYFPDLSADEENEVFSSYGEYT